MEDGSGPIRKVSDIFSLMDEKDVKRAVLNPRERRVLLYSLDWQVLGGKTFPTKEVYDLIVARLEIIAGIDFGRRNGKDNGKVKLVNHQLYNVSSEVKPEGRYITIERTD